MSGHFMAISFAIARLRSEGPSRNWRATANMASPLFLGLLPAQVRIGAWLFGQLAENAAPYVATLLRDPTGTVSRLGDVLLWNGQSGQHVLGTLECLSESQARIEHVVAHIETAQIGLAGTLGALSSLSMATLGLTALTAGYMVFRMRALHGRLAEYGEQLSDIRANLQAQDQAHLETSLDFLGRFEHTQSEKDLHTALEEGTYATNFYRGLVQRETQGQRRLLALNACGRYYLLSLTAQVRCQVLGNQLSLAEQRIAAEKPALAALVRTTFEAVMGKNPEVYLDPKLQADNVTLDLVTEIYQQAHKIGAVAGAEYKDAGQMFEHFRPKIYSAGGWFGMGGKVKEALLTKLKYLLACLEEVGRIESLRLRVAEAIKARLSFPEMEQAIRTMPEQAGAPDESDRQLPVAVFAIT